MTQQTGSATFSTASPGPLAWLFPELARFSSRPLESLLTEAAGRAGSGEVVLVTQDSSGAWQFESHSLSSPEAPSRLLDRAQDPAAQPLLPLHPGRGLEQRLNMALQALSGPNMLFRLCGIIPYFVTAPPAGSAERVEDADPQALPGPVETRLLPSWWGILPGDSYPPTLRELYRQLVGLLYPDRMPLFMALENYALAGIDLHEECLMDRFEVQAPTAEPGTPEVPGRRSAEHTPLIIGVCGIDGSGKSSHVAALETYLTGRGFRTSVQKIYRHGLFHDTVTELTRQCAGGRNLHLWRIQRLAKAFDSVKYYYSTVEEQLGACDAVIFDRYVFTHHAAGMGRYHHDPFTRELLAVFPPAHRIYLLDLPAGEALRRIGTRDQKTVDENPYMLSRYRHAFLDLARRNGFLVLDGRKSFEENSRIIIEDAARLVDLRSGTP